MYEIIPNGAWKKLILFALIICTLLLMVSYYDNSSLLNYRFPFLDGANSVDPLTNITSEEEYLVSSSKCKIVNLNPHSSDAKRYFKPAKYKSCTQKPLLSYVSKEDNKATVHIDGQIVHLYTNKNISCCYSDISRKTNPKSPDDAIALTDCKTFHNNVTLTQEAILIKCTEQDSNRKIYENVHTSIRVTEDVHRKTSLFDNSTKKPLSVLFIGIDSISRLNFIRALPNTYQYIEEKEWIPLKGYNKIDDNTFPNIMAIFTGYNQINAYKICNPKALGFMDKCPMLWYDYRKLGYVTAYAEDEAGISTFNYNKKGFTNPPTDYYFRPYVMATEKLSKVSVSSLTYCTGPETAGERILNIIKDFGVTFLNRPHLGIFWMNSFSHNEINTPTMMDNKLKSFLMDLESEGVNNSTIIIFISDHGMRFGDIRLTETGWLEERLPFIYFSFPPWFKDRFPIEYGNFRNNVNKLTTPYDLHMTLQHVLTLSGLNYSTKPSHACPKCKSLFAEIETERSCEEAGIEQHWCTCAGFTETKLDPKVEAELSQFVLDHLHKITTNVLQGGGEKCAKYSQERISTRISHKLSYRKSRNVLVTLTTDPKAVFEATVSFYGDIRNCNFSFGDISRLDSYGSHSQCVSDANIKKYCYCR